MRARAHGRSGESASAGDGLVHHHGVFGNHRIKERAQCFGRHIARGYCSRVVSRIDQWRRIARTQFTSQCFERSLKIVFCTGYFDHFTALGRQHAGLARVGEKSNRLFCANQHHLPRVLGCRQSGVHHKRQLPHRRTPRTALNARIARLAHQLAACFCRNASCPLQRFPAHCHTAQHQHR